MKTCIRVFILGLAILASNPAGSVDATATAVFLVAKPELQDPNFAHAVVLVVFPQGGGPLGVILNRPLKITLKDSFPDDARLKSRTDPLFFGGPVRIDGLLFLFRRDSALGNAFPVVDDLYLSGDGELLDQLLAKQGGGVQQFFLGYAGWTSSQLDFEIAQGAWYVVPADADTVLKADPHTLWRDMLLRATAVKA
jgi:putative transcriptional regulator